MTPPTWLLYPQTQKLQISLGLSLVEGALARARRALRQLEAQAAGCAGAHVVPGQSRLWGTRWEPHEEKSRQLRHPCPRYRGYWSQHQHLGPGPAYQPNLSGV